MTAPLPSTSSYHDFSGLQALKGQAAQDPQSQAALRGAARQFEALFVQEMLRSMRAAIPSGELFDSQALETFQGMFDKELAQQFSQRGSLGVADVIVRQLQPAVSTQSVLQGRDPLRLPPWPTS